MGVIWLQTTDGKLIHLPVVGADVNSPDDAVKIPTSVLTTKDRCLSGQVAIAVPGKGTVTFNFDPPGRSGSCNQCGSCCTHPVASCPMPPANCGYILDTQYNVHKCQYLSINPGNNKLGTPGQTSCSIRTTIFDICKGCALFPTKADDIANCPACGFTFSG